MAPTLTHEKSGRQVTVPEDAAGVYLENGWSVAGTAPAKAAPKKAATPRKRATTKKAAPAKAAEKGAPDAGADAGEGGTVPADAVDGAAGEG